MSDFESYEFVVTSKKDGKNSLLRVLLIMFYAFFVLGCLVFGFLTGFVPLLALVPLVLWIIIFFTWRYVKVEYEYMVESGVITFTKIYNNRTRRTVLTFDIRSAETILLANAPDTQRRIFDYDPRHEYSFASSNASLVSFVAFYKNEDDQKCALTFAADDKIKKFLKIYNAAALRNGNVSL